MTAQPKLKLTEAEYLAIERNAEFKSEFYDGEMFAMAGANRLHNIVNENLAGELYAKLKGTHCRTLSRDQRVRISRTGLYCYPDLIIVCGPPEYSIQDPDTLVNPRVIIEVLSDSTERYDRTTKLQHYQQLPSVMDYVMVSQHQPMCERFSRSPDGTWAFVAFVGMNAKLELTSVPVQVSLADIYGGVTFPELLQPNRHYPEPP